MMIGSQRRENNEAKKTVKNLQANNKVEE